MSEVFFYHLEKRSLDEVLPGLVERSLARGWRVLIRTESADRAQAIDNLLWTWSDESFLPHAQLGEGDATKQPVLITAEEGNPNSADVLFVVGGANPASRDEGSYSRVVIVFDGRDTAALSSARDAWKAMRESGREATYWRQSAQGKWEKQT